MSRGVLLKHTRLLQHYLNPPVENIFICVFSFFSFPSVTMTTEAAKDNFVRVVSFDTMTNKNLPNYSFTLRGKSQSYKRTRRSRAFMVATDLANYSEYALTWATDVSINCYCILPETQLRVFFFARKSWMMVMN